MAYPENRDFYEDYYTFADMKMQYPWAKSILICGYWYGKYKVPEKLRHHYGRAYLMDARLDKSCDEYKARVNLEMGMQAMGLRFHGDRLNDITCFRLTAQKAGLGIIRRNNFLYTEKGSWIYFDAWVLDEDLEIICDTQVVPCPDSCNRCQKNCATGTLCTANTMNPYRCTAFVSSLNVNGLNHNPIAPFMREWIYGCDDCQNVCPFNAKTEETEDFPHLAEQAASFLPEAILTADDQQLQHTVQPKFWYIEPYEAWKFKINVLNSLNNAECKPENLEQLLEFALKDPKTEVRHMAAWVKEKLFDEGDS